MDKPFLRRLGSFAAACALALGTVVATATATQAQPPNCVMAAGAWFDGGNNIHAYRMWSCENGTDILLPLNIDKYQSPGNWTTVASGTGYADYYCSSTIALNLFRSSGAGQYQVACT